MATYKATQAIYLSGEGKYIEEGQTFTSDLPPGLAWEPIDDAAIAAVEALNASDVIDTPAKGAKAAS